MSTEAATEVAETETPATEAPAEPKNLNQLLDELPAKEPKGKKPKEDAEDEDTLPDAGAKKPDAKPKAEPKAKTKELAKKATAELSSDDIFTDAALATPEGVKRAREVALAAKGALETRHQRLDSMDIRLKTKEKALGERETKVEATHNHLATLGQAFARDMATLRGHRTSSPVEIMATLDRMAGGPGDARAGVELLEAIQIAVGRDGKAPEKTRAELEWERKFQALEQKDQAREARLRAMQEQHQISELEQQVAQDELRLGALANNPENFPGIAGFIEQGGTDVAGVGKWVADALEDARARGEVLDIAEVLGTLESKLAKFASAQRPAQDGREAAGASPRARQSTVLPDDADRSNGRGRKLTHDERLDAIARDPAAMRSIFGKAF